MYFLSMSGATPSTSEKILRRVRAGGRGCVFTPSDFLDLGGGRAAVARALSRLIKSQQLRRLARGLYDYPKIHPQLGPLSPDLDTVAMALARETGSQLQIAGARAANFLGLSDQVPAHDSYLTDGPSRQVVLGKRVVDLRHASPKNLIAAGSAAGTVVQALRHLGPSRAGEVAEVAGCQLSPADKKLLETNTNKAPAWMRPTLAAIARTAPGAQNGVLAALRRSPLVGADLELFRDREDRAEVPLD